MLSRESILECRPESLLVRLGRETGPRAERQEGGHNGGKPEEKSQDEKQPLDVETPFWLWRWCNMSVDRPGWIDRLPHLYVGDVSRVLGLASIGIGGRLQWIILTCIKCTLLQACNFYGCWHLTPLDNIGRS